MRPTSSCANDTAWPGSACTVHADGDPISCGRQNDEIKRLTQISLDQNEQVKRISAWAAIRFAPTLVGTIYGMNFMHMPELGWILGYPLALLAMAALGGVLYLIFKRHGWL